MTTCILSGFAKKKKFVGGVYACNGSDLPATQDFGTIQYQGPSETELAVPATTVTYTIIGKTPCGDDVRRITTKTYSNRSVIDNYKLIGNFVENVLFHVSPAWSATLTGYGLTLNACMTDMANKAILLCPQSCTTDLGAGSTPIGSQLITSPTTRVYTKHTIGGTQPIDTYVSDDMSAQVPTLVTLYYLDVHEVWTYDLV